MQGVKRMYHLTGSSVSVIGLSIDGLQVLSKYLSVKLIIESLGLDSDALIKLNISIKN